MGVITNPTLLKEKYNKMIYSYKKQNSFLYGNHIWISKGMTLKEDYQNQVLKNFDSKVSPIEFQRPQAVNDVNRWISDKTNGKIPKLVDSFSANTEMFMANALYFGEKWLEPFEDAGNKNFSYNVGGNRTDIKTVSVPMIRRTSKEITYGKFYNKNFKKGYDHITIPYHNPDFEMQLIIPEDMDGLIFLEKDLELTNVMDNDILGKNNNLFKLKKNESDEIISEVSIIMPKFKLRSKFNAADGLKAMGATDIFTEAAELDKIVDGPIRVGKVQHEAVVEVTKEGTEGAAATGVEIVLFSADFDTKYVRVDRPFIFIIQDKVNNIPVLVGRVNNPAFP